MTLAPVHVPALDHRATVTRWLPPDLPTRLDADWVAARYDEVDAACDAAGTDPAAWTDVVLQRSELEAFIASRATRVGLAFRQSTNDSDAKAEYRRLNEEITPVASRRSFEVTRRLVDGPCVDAVTARFGDLFMQQERAAVTVHDPVNTEVRTELSNVLMEHTEIFGKATIEWKGETMPYSFARKAALDPDRSARHAAWESANAYVRANEDAIQRIYDRARDLRGQLASNVGMADFVDFRYLEMQRFGYGQEEVARFRGAVARHLVPLATRIHAEQAAVQGTDLLHPADALIYPDPSPQLMVPVAGQLDEAGRVFDRLGDAFGEPWRVLADEGLIDLEARPGKGTGAFCATLYHERVPYIFCNSVGSHDDVRTLVHEFGHAMQSWYSRHIEPMQLRFPTYEACELHSMTLELLVHPEMDGFFGHGTDEYRREHHRSNVVSMPYMAAIDEFQHRVYREGLDAAARAEVWQSTARTYQPGIDWSADAWYGGARWMMQLHVFQYPFYYIDYALARMVSWELWLDSLDDREGAIERYLELCRLGGTMSFRDLVARVGLGDPFGEGTIERTVDRLQPFLT